MFGVKKEASVLRETLATKKLVPSPGSPAVVLCVYMVSALLYNLFFSCLKCFQSKDLAAMVLIYNSAEFLTFF